MRRFIVLLLLAGVGLASAQDQPGVQESPATEELPTDPELADEAATPREEASVGTGWLVLVLVVALLLIAGLVWGSRRSARARARR